MPPTIDFQQCIIRPFSVSDLPQITAIEKAAHLSPWSDAIFLRTVNSGKQVFVLAQQDNVIAYAVISLIAGESELLNLSVAPALQGQGAGKYLLSHVIDLVAADAEQMFLEVRESNSVAINLYESLGFSELDRRVNYYPAAKGREDALIMALPFVDN